MPSRLRTVAGAIFYDLIPFELRVRQAWQHVRNRHDRVVIDGRAVECQWDYAADLHYPKVFPSAAKRLQRAALREFPIVLAESRTTAEPLVTFIIGHRGQSRLPQLLTTLRSIAAQTIDVECVVVEQSHLPETASMLPPWVRYVHQAVDRADAPYNRSATFNEGARHARSGILVLHDNDMLAPSAYAAEIVRQAQAGFEAMDLKRFVFYLSDQGEVQSVVENVRGGSIAITAAAYEAIGGSDEEFAGWGGEDNELWERAETRRCTRFGYLPFLHLAHEPQPEKAMGRQGPGAERYWELRDVPPHERIARLRR